MQAGKIEKCSSMPEGDKEDCEMLDKKEIKFRKE